ncbi:MAG TPA: FtsX-like permease family protein [Candidatus Saccharimonadales bacterium]|nr:FtsX-like permease family protein [Candidatus Saccharimonadales bacterium]
MNVVTRGVRGALRSPLRSGAIIAMLAISIGLILAMLVARSSVEAKIEEVKASVATKITINPAGVQGGFGQGDPLTSDQVAKIKATDHISSISATLTANVKTDETTSLASAMEGGRFMLRSPDGTESSQKPPIIATGSTNPEGTIASDKVTSGSTIDGSSSDNVALIGKELATKNNLSVGSTFTLYGKTFTVKGIYSTDNKFQDGGLYVPLAALQTASDQAGKVSNVVATADSSDNVTSTVAALKSALGDAADITSQADQADTAVAPLSSISGLALGGVIAATIAGAVIVLLAMIMVVRERRREIGVIKAIGGSNRSIITQFITEGLTLTIIGGIVGLALGIAVSGPLTQSLVSNQSSSSGTEVRGEGPVNVSGGGGSAPRMMRGGPSGFSSQLGQNLTSVTSSVTPATFAGGIAIILLIAIIGSAVPAWAIARVRPAEVLRTE